LVLDLCSAPGGKATEISHTGATVIANDIRPHRIELVAQNVRRLGLTGRVIPVLADGANVPFPPATFDRVLVDAPCTGLGVLHRRPDARWRVVPEDIDALVALQRQLLSAAIDLLRPGGTLVYSVCTLTDAETVGNDRWMAVVHPALTPTSPPPSPWMAHGRGARLLPQTTDTDGMSVFSYRAE
jgi:16S rRNA (cytosine967-C5)-methyltransferase